MYQLESIIIENLLSIEKVEYPFEQGKSILVQGENKTDSSQKSNGSGKSAFHGAIELVITGNFSRKVSTDKKLIREGQEDPLFIQLVLKHTNHRLTIERTLYQKDSSTLKILKDDLEDPELKFATIGEGNKLIEKLLGISFKDLRNYFLPNELTYVSFFRSSDTETKELISRFSKTDILDPVYDHIQEDVDVVDKKYEDVEKEITKLETKIEVYDGQILEEKDRDFDSERKEKIDTLQEDINQKKIHIKEKEDNNIKLSKSIQQYSETTTEVESAVKRVEKKIDELKKDTNKSEFFNESKLLKSDLEDKKDGVKENFDKHTKDSNSYSKQLAAINTLLAGEITCPKCSHKFILSSLYCYKDLQKFQKELESSILKTNKIIKTIEKDLIIFKNGIEEVETLEEGIRLEVTNINKEIDTLGLSLSERKKTLNSVSENSTKDTSTIKTNVHSIGLLKEEIKNLENSIEETKKLEDDTDKLKKLEENKQLQVTELAKKKQHKTDIEVELLEVESWIGRFKSFRSYLANKQLRAITGYTNKYLREFGTDIQVSIEGFKQLTSGETREKITPYVYRNGKIRDYGQFSKGEKAKIDYAVLLSLQTLINLTSPSGGIDFLFPDEIIEGVDSLGLMSLVKALAKTGKTNYLTTHVLGDFQYENVLMFVKEDNITRVHL